MKGLFGKVLGSLCIERITHVKEFERESIYQKESKLCFFFLRKERMNDRRDEQAVRVEGLNQTTLNLFHHFRLNTSSM